MKINRARFLEAMHKAKITSYAELSRKSGIDPATISLHLNNRREVGHIAMAAYEKALSVSSLWLQAKDDELKKFIGEAIKEYHSDVRYIPKEEIVQAEPRSLPLYSCPVPCGSGQFLVDHIERYLEVTWSKRADFIIQAKGNSMLELGIVSGTYVGIKKLREGQPIENGKVVLVCYKDDNGEPVCTLKKYQKKGQNVEFTPANHEYKAIRPKEFKILGLAVDIYKEL